jgi:hypothetical protein
VVNLGDGRSEADHLAVNTSRDAGKAAASVPETVG